MKPRPSLIFGIGVAVTAIWIGGAGYYIWCKWSVTFPNLQPSEWGEFLAGWSATLALFWAFAAVMYQREQLANEASKANQQSKQIVEESARKNLEHLLKQLGQEIHTLSHSCEKCDLHGPRGESESLSDLIGEHQRSLQFMQGGQYRRLIEEVGVGLETFVTKVYPDSVERREWSINANDDDLEKLMDDIGSIKGTSKEIVNRLSKDMEIADCPSKKELEVFCQRAEAAFTTLQAIQQECRDLDEK